VTGTPPFPNPGLYPFQGRAFDRGGGIRMNYLDEGTGPPVVMVHGNPWWSFCWRGLFLRLRDRHRCLAPDHVGCGLSDAPPDRDYAYTLATRVADLDSLLSHAGVEGRVSLVLHDWGGMIGMAWAVRHPERVERIVAMNTAAFRLPAGKRLPRELGWVRGPLGPLLVRGLNAFARGAVRRCAVKPLSAAVRGAYLAPWPSWNRRRAALRFVQDIPLGPGDRSWPVLEETERGLERLRDRPLLLCWGMRDFVFDGEFLAEWVRRFPGAEVRRFEEAGHLVMEDAGAEVESAVEGFLGGAR